MTATKKRRNRLRAAVLLVAVAVLIAVSGVWFSLDRVTFDLTAARDRLASTASGPEQTVPVASSRPQSPASGEQLPIAEASKVAGIASSSGSTSVPAIEPIQVVKNSGALEPVDAGPPEAEDREVILLVGSDEQPSKKVARADAIMLLVVESQQAALVSVPRYLYVDSPCTGEPAPLNTNLGGCDGVPGLEVLGIAIEDYSGVTIDRFALFDFEGFTSIIDLIGGYEVCVDRPVKLSATRRVFLEEGCTTLDGKKALRWIRTRVALEQHAGQWSLIGGGGDHVRTERQRDLLRYVLARVGELDEIGELLQLASATSDLVTLDKDWPIRDAVALAWSLRSVDLAVGSIEGEWAISPTGDLVVLPTQTFSQAMTAILDS